MPAGGLFSFRFATSMKIPTEQPKWTSDMAAALRQFLNTTPGQTFLQQMYWLRPVPPMLPATHQPIDPTTRIAHADQLFGYERAIQDILALTSEPVNPQTL